MSVVCGSTAASACKNDPVREADPNQLHEVRCCSDTSLGNGWKQHANCQAAGFGTWGESDISGVCNRAKTYNEAVDICEAVGARLCTEEELLADCARGTGKYKLISMTSFSLDINDILINTMLWISSGMN
jgi:hypothetical protein